MLLIKRATDESCIQSAHNLSEAGIHSSCLLRASARHLGYETVKLLRLFHMGRLPEGLKSVHGHSMLAAGKLVASTTRQMCRSSYSLSQSEIQAPALPRTCCQKVSKTTPKVKARSQDPIAYICISPRAALRSLVVINGIFGGSDLLLTKEIQLPLAVFERFCLCLILSLDCEGKHRFGGSQICIGAKINPGGGTPNPTCFSFMQ